LTAASDTDGAAVTLQDCSSAAGQAWITTGGTFKTLTNKCLDVPSGSLTPGTKLQIWTCGAGNNNQAFSISSGKISWGTSGECLDLTDGSVANGNLIQVWTCSTGNNNQVWSIV